MLSRMVQVCKEIYTENGLLRYSIAEVTTNAFAERQKGLKFTGRVILRVINELVGLIMKFIWDFLLCFMRDVSELKQAESKIVRQTNGWTEQESELHNVVGDENRSL